MSTLFIVLLLVSFLGLLVGLVKPSWVRMPSRKRAGLIFGIAFVVFFILVGITAPPVPPSDHLAAQTSPAPSSVANSSTSAAATSTQVITDPCASSTTASFQKITDMFTADYQKGKEILGTTQYADAYAGLAALNNPNSAASKFSTWHNAFVEEQASMTPLLVKAYNSGSNCYYGANLNEPDALGNWRDDQDTVLSDIGVWGSDAVDWQIQSTPTSKLNQDEATIAVDLATVQNDIAALR